MHPPFAKGQHSQPHQNASRTTGHQNTHKPLNLRGADSTTSREVSPMRIFEGVAKLESVVYAIVAVSGMAMIGFGAAIALH